MRALELFEYSKFTDGDFDRLKLAIKRDCKQCLEVYLMNGEQPLYRGIDDYRGIGFTDQPRTDRMPRDTAPFVHNFMNEGLRLLGSPVLRSNSLATTGNDRVAFDYATNVYAIFPQDGFHFMWSPYYKDFAELGFDAYRHLKSWLISNAGLNDRFKSWLKPTHPETGKDSKDDIINYPVHPDAVDKPILTEFWTHIAKSKKIKIDDDFDSAVVLGCEVMLTGSYHAVKKSLINKYFWRDMLTAFD